MLTCARSCVLSGRAMVACAGELRLRIIACSMLRWRTGTGYARGAREKRERSTRVERERLAHRPLTSVRSCRIDERGRVGVACVAIWPPYMV